MVHGRQFCWVSSGPNISAYGCLRYGCGPGTITADFAALVPAGHLTGLEHAPEVLDQAHKVTAEREAKNVKFQAGNVHALEYPDNTSDVGHAH